MAGMQELSPAERQRTIVTVRQIDLPLNEPTDLAWEVVDEGIFSRRAREVWNRNGIRIGRLSRSELGDFADKLPTMVATPISRFVLGHQPAPLHIGPLLRSETQVDLADLSDQAPSQVQRGSWRLLARARTQAGQVNLGLMPHHYRSRLSLLPRDPLEKSLDGHVLEDMMVQVALQSDTVIVVGLHRPWPEDFIQQLKEAAEDREMGRRTIKIDPFTDDTGNGASQANELDSQSETQGADDDTPDLPYHIGRGMFTARRFDEPVQMLLLITARPAASMRFQASQ
jgi:hypothetical protein